MRSRKTKRNILMVSLVGILFLMTAGYAAFQTNLKIKGSGTIAGKWNIEITGVSEGTPTGHAENASTPTYSALTANMEANLYDKGSAMEYDVTIENKGNIDATLEEIQQSEITNEAIKISVTGYTKGEILEKASSKTVHVKIEYDENYQGEAEDGTNASLEVTFVFGQADSITNQGGEVVTTGKYKVSFDCKTNGSSSCANNDEYYAEGAEIALTSKLPTEPKGYTFKGWGLTSDATEYITEYTVTDEDVTIYAIYEGKEGPSITNIATTSTTNSINVVVTATDSNSTIETYEYSKDGGDSWATSDNSTYTFNNLKQNTEYEIYVRVTNEDEGTTYSDKTKVKTKTIDAPAFAVKSISGSDKTIEITYPEVTKDDGTKLTCQSGLTCSYGKNGLDFETVTNTTETLSFNDVGTIIAKVSDGTNEVSNSYTINTTGKLADYSTLSSTTLYTTYKTNITSIDIVDYNTIPEEAVESWNVSDADSAGTVNAWIIEDSETSGKYKLYIGSPQGVIANEDSSDLFNGFSSVTNVNLNLLDTSKVTNMSSMFSGVNSLISLDVSNFDTSNATNMQSMFSGVSSLTSLNLSNFNTASVTNMSEMFNSATNLETIYVSSKFVTTSVTNSTNMFNNDSSIVGGNGTVYDSSKIDKEYARVDTFENKGYFTDRSIPIINKTATSSTTHSVTVVVSASVLDKYTIIKYEYSKDGGSTWEESTEPSYTFTSLKEGTIYPIKVRVTSNTGQSTTAEIAAGTNAEDLTDLAVTTGDGLYQDTYEPDRYIYKGTSPDNYLTFNNETAGWRIYSVEKDGGFKIVRGDGLSARAFDSVGTRTTGYCSQGDAPTKGCNAWAKMDNFVNGDYSGVVEDDSELNKYLNGSYYDSLSSAAKTQIQEHDWQIGYGDTVEYGRGSLNPVLSNMSSYIWKGNIALLNPFEFMRANSNLSSCYTSFGNLWSNRNTCKTTNYLVPLTYDYWLLNPDYNSTNSLGRASTEGFVGTTDASGVFKLNVMVRPALYIKPHTKLLGSGTSGDPYYISSSNVTTKKIDVPTYMEESETETDRSIIIDYNNDCSQFTCQYSTDNGSTWSSGSTSDSETVTIENKNPNVTNTVYLVARVSDNNGNTVTTDSYGVYFEKPEVTFTASTTEDLEESVVSFESLSDDNYGVWMGVDGAYDAYGAAFNNTYPLSVSFSLSSDSYVDIGFMLSSSNYTSTESSLSCSLDDDDYGQVSEGESESFNGTVLSKGNHTLSCEYDTGGVPDGYSDAPSCACNDPDSGYYDMSECVEYRYSSDSEGSCACNNPSSGYYGDPQCNDYRSGYVSECPYPGSEFGNPYSDIASCPYYGVFIEGPPGASVMVYVEPNRVLNMTFPSGCTDGSYECSYSTDSGTHSVTSTSASHICSPNDEYVTAYVKSAARKVYGTTEWMEYCNHE